MDFIIRAAEIEDTAKLFELIMGLARYEQMEESVTGSSQELAVHLFGPKPQVEAIVADYQGEVMGFALFFPNYSTFLTKPGIYLEDLFVLPSYRRQGIATALLVYLAQLAMARGAGRLEWSVLAWNQTAIDFYQKMGAEVLSDWRICRVTGKNLGQLADKIKI